MSLIDLALPTAASVRELHQTPGAFLWWYADLANQVGDALVLIWSLGLPFLPGSRKPSTPAARPALSLSVYRGGRPDFYLLQDYARGPAAALDASGSGSLGGTRFHISESKDVLTLTATLNEPIPGSRQKLSGCVTLTGASARVATGSAASHHCWAPRSCSARGSANLRIGERRIELEGSAYLDANFSRTPLAEQGIQRWLWGRVAFADRTLVFYQTIPEHDEPETLLLEQPRVGSLRPLRGELHWTNWRRSTYGLRAPRALRVHTGAGAFSAVLGAPVDDGPFYQRFLVQARADSGETGHGVAELVVPGAIDRSWQRPFIRMRTHCVGGANSMWLPLFTGPRAGRVARLLRTSVAT